MKLIDSRNKGKIAPLGTLNRILKEDFTSNVSKAEIWGLAAVAAATVVAGGTAAVMSSQAQKNAAKTAAGAELSATAQNNNLSAGIYNANAGLSSSSRALGGLAQQQLAYDLGLSPNLNIASTQVTPQIDSSGNVSYIDANGNSVGGGTGANATGGPTTAPVKPQYDPVTQTWVTPTNNGAYGQTIMAGATPVTPTSPTNGTPSPGTTGAPTPNGGWNVNGGGLQVGPPATSNTQPVAQSTAHVLNVNPPLNGSAPTGSVPGPSNNSGTGAGPNTNGTPYGGLSNPYNPSTFFLSPDYQFNLQQGQAALNRSNAASGNSASGAALKSAMTFAEGLSSQDYNAAFNNSLASNAQTYNMLQGAVSGGMVGNAATGAAGNQVGSQMTNNNTNAGNAIANQATATGNANSNMYNNLAGIGMNLASKYGSSSTPSSTPPTSYSNGNTMTVGGDMSGNGQYIVNIPN